MFGKSVWIVLTILVVGEITLGVKSKSSKGTSGEEEASKSSRVKAEKYAGEGGSNSDVKYSASYPSSSLSYYGNYGYGGNYPYGNGGSYEGGKGNYYGPYHTEPNYYERSGKDFSTRTSQHMPMAMAASQNFGNFGSSSHGSSHQSKEVTGPEFGGLASASGKGWSTGGDGWGKSGGGWGGGGGGWGWGHQAKGSDNRSALGALALIGLLSLFRNVLANMMSTTTTTTAMMMMGGRRKRELLGDDLTDDHTSLLTDESAEKISRISMLMLPSFNVIAHARQGNVPLECTHREVCFANSILLKELGSPGRSVGSMINSAVTKFLRERDDTGGIDKHVIKASLAGRNGHDCAIVYPQCKILKKNNTPLPILLSPKQIADITMTNQRTKSDNS